MTKIQTVVLDSEEDDIAEANCELAMVQGQLCNVPYDLYDLPDLNGILSVETWNTFLTEDERFFLSCYLPDMDHDTFILTMQELLRGGDSFCFGNPVDKFYLKLRGGMFTPKVASYNEGFMFIKKRMYYYSLRFYHQKMIKRFTEMQWLWDQCGKELGNYGRLLLWSERTQTRNLLDLERVTSEKVDGATCKLTAPKGLLKLVPKSSSAILGEAPGKNLRQVHETGSKSTSSPFSGGRFSRKPYGTIACSITEVPNCLLNHQDTSSTCLETSSIEETERMLHDPNIHYCRGLGVSKYLPITEQSPLAKKEEYAHYHLKKSFLAGKNFQRDANVLRKPLHALGGDNHAREDDLFSLTYKRRKVQRLGTV